MHPDLPNHIYKLRKSIYGLKQAPRAWFAKLSDRLISLGFRCFAFDSSLFILRTDSICLFTLVYVDDIIVTRSSSQSISDFINFLASYFPVKDLGPLHFFLGIEVTRNNAGLFLAQNKYISDLLLKTNMHNCISISTPMYVSKYFFAIDGNAFEDPQWYRSVVGSLQYLAFTRLDISFAVNCVCQFMRNPHLTHWKAIKRILCYLNHTCHFGLHFTSSSACSLSAFSDVDWAGCPDDRRSTSGYCLYFGSHLIY